MVYCFVCRNYSAKKQYHLKYIQFRYVYVSSWKKYEANRDHQLSSALVAFVIQQLFLFRHRSNFARRKNVESNMKKIMIDVFVASFYLHFFNLKRPHELEQCKIRRRGNAFTCRIFKCTYCHQKTERWFQCVWQFLSV